MKIHAACRGAGFSQNGTAMHVLIAPDKFKGSMPAAAAAESISRGWRSVFPEAEISLAPIADGGEGFAAALCSALSGEWIETVARDPLGRDVPARYAWIPKDQIAIVDMAETAGLWRLAAEERNPRFANTYGVGQLMRHAIELGARKILVGLGGSATTDGGAGMAAALGYDFLDTEGRSVEPLPHRLLEVVAVASDRVIALPEIIAACDVQNPLLGDRGTARVFAPQKGADEAAVEELEAGLSRFADAVESALCHCFRDYAGAGAAGGIGFGLLAFCNASIESGFDLVSETLGLHQKTAAADLVITGEGKLDLQTLEGKGPMGVAALARKHGKPVLALAGAASTDARLAEAFDAILPIVDEPISLGEAMKRGPEFLERAAGRAAQLVKLGKLIHTSLAMASV